MKGIDHLTDRQLLEWVYALQIQILAKLNEIGDDRKEFGLNLAADLVGNMLDDTKLNRNTR